MLQTISYIHTYVHTFITYIHLHTHIPAPNGSHEQGRWTSHTRAPAHFELPAYCARSRHPESDSECECESVCLVQYRSGAVVLGKVKGVPYRRRFGEGDPIHAGSEFYVCMYVCMYTCQVVCLYVCVRACGMFGMCCIWIRVCMCVCMCVISVRSYVCASSTCSILCA
jgi:hypothetical protein